MWSVTKYTKQKKLHYNATMLCIEFDLRSNPKRELWLK